MIRNALDLNAYLSNSKTAVSDPIVLKTDNKKTETADKAAVNQISDFLDLSDAAKKLLAGQTSTETAKKQPELSQPFLLSAKQTDKIKEIIGKYKDAPMNKQTFQAIEADIKTAGMNHDKLAALDSVSQFKKTNSLMSFMNGSKQPAKQEVNLADMKNKATEFRKAVYNYWKEISTQKPAS